MAMAAAVSSGRARCAWFGSATDKEAYKTFVIEEQGSETADEFILVSDRQDAAGIPLHPLDRLIDSLQGRNVPGRHRGQKGEVFVVRRRDRKSPVWGQMIQIQALRCCDK